MQANEQRQEKRSDQLMKNDRRRNSHMMRLKQIGQDAGDHARNTEALA